MTSFTFPTLEVPTFWSAPNLTVHAPLDLTGPDLVGILCIEISRIAKSNDFSSILPIRNAKCRNKNIKGETTNVHGSLPRVPY
jgi:hypothetical protein